MKALQISKDSTTVTVYHIRSHGHYQLVWHENGVRRRKTITRLEDAKNEAQKILTNLCNGKSGTAPLGVDDAIELATAREIIRDTKIPLLTFLREAVRGWEPGFEKMKVRDVVKAYREKHRKRSVKFKDDLRWRLDAFVDEFGSQYIDMVRGPKVRSWIDQRTFKNKPASGRTKTNFLSMLRGLWSFAQARQWIPEGTHQLTHIDGWEHDPAAYAFMPANELSQLLDRCNDHVARDQLVPYLALQAWGGLRSAEATRISWEEIIVRDGRVTGLTISALKSKTRTRRPLDASPALAAMLHEWAVIRRMSGPICIWRKLPHILRRLHKEPFIPEYNSSLMSGRAQCDDDDERIRYRWRHNQLRHTFASHLLRLWGDANRVGLYLGTSTAMLHSHYKEFTTPEETEQWMSMRPVWEMPQPKPETPEQALGILI